ncbi:GntR family transcriptional regulator [Streptomyces fulvoviolaceus]|uniref:hypothetical protein n=1 Tax=Streptomyces fulvoviolaceus TaxID=285535 RepID=UPI0021C0A7D9|nr:hypothetical protein [Streptomyces fulvoviolaceus]MCT9081108.1 hypothetical protein [Streptomyces fulvoviolaceus]
MTASRAVRELRERGLVHTVVGKDSFVVGPSEDGPDSDKEPPLRCGPPVTRHLEPSDFAVSCEVKAQGF